MDIENMIIDFFFTNPNVKINIRELSRILSLNHMSVRNNLNILFNEGVLVKDKRTLEHVFSLNLKEESVKLKKRLWNIQKLYESGIIHHIDELFESPKSIVLFGSYSFGEDSEKSDIDIAVQTSISKEAEFKKYEKRLGRKIQLFTFSDKDDKNLLRSIYNGIVLKGRIQ